MICVVLSVCVSSDMRRLRQKEREQEEGERGKGRRRWLLYLVTTS